MTSGHGCTRVVQDISSQARSPLGGGIIYANATIIDAYLFQWKEERRPCVAVIELLTIYQLHCKRSTPVDRKIVRLTQILPDFV